MMLSESLKLLRMFAGIQQAELAAKLGISKSHLSELEAGKKAFTVEMLNRYSALFDIPVSLIFVFSEKLASEGISERIRLDMAKKALRILTSVGSEAIEKEEEREARAV
jgi:transcriptional regulator with XRE-family HTH domain